MNKTPKHEKGCEYMFKMRLDSINQQFKLGKAIARGMFRFGTQRTKSEVDYDCFMKEPIKCKCLGKLKRRIKLWTWECTL
jgi:hypothetical protein